jgi:hypothetical protein
MARTIEKAREVLRARYGKWFVNTVWGHIIYKPIRRPRFKLPYGMKTLDEFVRWHQREFDMMQGEVRKGKGEHPLALEIYFSITLKRTLDKREVAIITSALTEELINELFIEIAEYMEWGYDYEESPTFIPAEAMKRISKDGEDFAEIDLKKKLAYIETRLR